MVLVHNLLELSNKNPKGTLSLWSFGSLRTFENMIQAYNILFSIVLYIDLYFYEINYWTGKRNLKRVEIYKVW